MAMGLFGSSKRQLLGVDIGASAVKILFGKKNRKGFAVEKFIAVPVPPHCIDERGITNTETVGASLGAALDAAGSSRDAVATQIHGPSVLLKRIVVQAANDKDIREMVVWEAEQVFSVDRESIIVDCVIGGSRPLPGAPANTQGKDVLLVGVRLEEAQNMKALMARVQANMKVMDVDMLAANDFIGSLLNLPPTDVVAFVDVGASATRIGVRRGEHLLFYREFVIGGNTFTETIAQTLGISFEDAEALKVSQGTGTPAEVSDAIGAIFVTWKNELQQTEDLYVSGEDSGLIHHWYVFGGGSLTPGMVASAQQDKRFANRISLLNAASFLYPGHKSIDAGVLSLWAPRLMTAGGLAMRSG